MRTIQPLREKKCISQIENEWEHCCKVLINFSLCAYCLPYVRVCASVRVCLGYRQWLPLRMCSILTRWISKKCCVFSLFYTYTTTTIAKVAKITDQSKTRKFLRALLRAHFPYSLPIWSDGYEIAVRSRPNKHFLSLSLSPYIAPRFIFRKFHAENKLNIHSVELIFCIITHVGCQPCIVYNTSLCHLDNGEEIVPIQLGPSTQWLITLCTYNHVQSLRTDFAHYLAGRFVRARLGAIHGVNHPRFLAITNCSCHK